ncbi:MAG TPA: hypothetical protein VI431_00095 [Candidatus Acidoferrum sp.]
MKRIAILSVLLLLAVFILLPGAGNGKYNVSNPVVADGSPLPWPPIPSGNTVLTADGSPLPWPPIPNSNTVMIADGSPLPWPPIPNTNA